MSATFRLPALALSLVCLAAPALAPPARAAAGTAELANGDRLSGDGLTMTDGVLRLDPPWGDAIAVELAAVARIVAAEPVTVELANGERLQGPLLAGAEPGTLLVDAGGDAPVAVPFAEVAALDPPPPPGWSGSVSFGGTAQRGNTRRTTVTASAEARHEDEVDRTTLRFRWVDAKEDRRRTSRSTYGEAQYDRFLGERLYAFASAEALSDELRDLDLRTVASLGMGWQVAEGEPLALSVEAGLSYLSRDFVVAPDEDELTLRLGGDVATTLFGRLRLADALVVYPTVDDLGTFVLRNELTASTHLVGDWALELSNVLDYDSDPPPGLDEEDLLWVVALRYVFD